MVTERDRYPSRLRAPPSPQAPKDLQRWHYELLDAVNAFPAFSVFSGGPNSTVTATKGTIGINVSPSSATSLLWAKQSSVTNLAGWTPFA